MQPENPPSGDPSESKLSEPTQAKSTQPESGQCASSSCPTKKPGLKRVRTFTGWLSRWRLLVQSSFVLIWAVPFQRMQMHGVCGPVFHCYACPWSTFACPIGVMANFSALHVIPFIAIGTIIFFAAMLGALICGWVCPFGLLQDLLGKIPLPKVKLPAFFGHFRYVVLILCVFTIPYLFGGGLEENPQIRSSETETRVAQLLGEGSEHFDGVAENFDICRICPASAIETSVPIMIEQARAGEEVTWPNPIKLGVTIFVLVAAMITWRPWCTLLCPLGAIFTLFNRFSFFPLKFHSAKCNDCNACQSMCNYRGANQRRASESTCIRCLDCTKCPTGALTLSTVLTNPDSEKKES